MNFQRFILYHVAVIVLVAHAVAAPLYSVTDLGVAPAFRGHFSGINNNGQVAGSRSLGFDLARPFLWTSDGGIQDLDSLPGGGEYGYAYDINDQGQVVGVSYGDEGSRALLWESGGGMLDLGDLPGGYDSSRAYAINDSGQVVGYGNVDGATQHAFLWTSDSGMRDIGDLPGGNDSSVARGINNSGQVVGASATASGGRAFLWTSGGGIQDLGVGDDSMAYGINDSGQVVGVATSNRAFLWTSDGGMQDLGDLLDGGSDSVAYGINAFGRVVGASYTSRGYCAFLWTSDEGMQDLNSLLNDSDIGWPLVFASAINDAGQIVAIGAKSDEPGRVFLLTPVSEPLPGDTNGDQTVDLNDLNNVRNNFGLAGAGIAGDTNADQLVNLVDLNNVRNYFGASAPQAVPEPSTVFLAVCGIAAGLFSRVRWRGRPAGL